MRLSTSYGLCSGIATAAVDWRYPDGDDHQRVPYGAINAALLAFYRLDAADNSPGEFPYFYIVYDDGRMVGLLLGDVQRVDDQGNTVGVVLSEDDKLYQFRTLMEEQREGSLLPECPDAWRRRTFWRSDLGLAGIEWEPFPDYTFPAVCFNAVLNGLYNENIQPVLYPVFDPEDESGTTPQIGVLFSEENRDPGVSFDEFTQAVTGDFRGLMAIAPDLEATELPWRVKEFHVG